MAVAVLSVAKEKHRKILGETNVGLLNFCFVSDGWFKTSCAVPNCWIFGNGEPKHNVLEALILENQ